MKNIRYCILLTTFCFIYSNFAFGYKEIGKVQKNAAPTATVAAGCIAPTNKAELTINNTRALVLTGGDMWWDLNTAHYEIPKNSGRNSLYAGALWMGGKDETGNLKMAAQRFRSGGNVDYWTGPLEKQTAQITSDACEKWDKQFISNRQDVLNFKAWYDAGVYDKANNTTTQSTLFPSYTIPPFILNWPAHPQVVGDGRSTVDQELAPYYDRSDDHVYDPMDGDYPGYELNGQPDCSEKISNIYGDQNIWWIFNDRGNLHRETNSESIGLEIRAQAFAFATNDEVNNMTFYNYEIINQSTFTLNDTYFGQFVDADLGGAFDDYVGSDVQRGLGYCYNGDNDDQDYSGNLGYGSQPPAIGVDFFQGPFQDKDSLDNPGPFDGNDISCEEARDKKGVPYKGIGIGYGDGKIDNERFGMARFLYFNNAAGNRAIGDPDNGPTYYNYLRGIWGDNSQMLYSGNGHKNGGGQTGISAKYMFPDDSDPKGWGTNCQPQPRWTEVTANNPVGDRRFVQSAGPFTLKPGNTNNITVGVVWARATSGGPLASVELLRRADDKTQALFDNCFQVVDGPDAPDLACREMDREIILYLSNRTASNNFNETYHERDPFIIPPDSVDTNSDGKLDYKLTTQEKIDYNTYRFQGYLIYQVKDKTVGASDLDDPEKARLIAQCDLKDGVNRIINYLDDESLGANIPVEMVNGKDSGIVRTFRITEDKFLKGDPKLINHKTVYFMALAYAYNSSPYSSYDPKLDGDGVEGKQRKPFLAGRKSAAGAILATACIPHKNAPEQGGMKLNSNYGDGVQLTRLEGTGNGGNTNLEITKASREKAVSGSPWRIQNPVYETGKGPVKIKVIDPFSVPKGSFKLMLTDTLVNTSCLQAGWKLCYAADGTNFTDTVYSDTTINLISEQLIPKWGLSVKINQISNSKDALSDPDNYCDRSAPPTARLTFDDPSKNWLTGVKDKEGTTPLNWIFSGTSKDDSPEAEYNDYHDAVSIPGGTTERAYWDPLACYEGLLEGIVAPFKLCSNAKYGPLHSASFNNINRLDFLQNVDIVFTSDKSKWTRCPVIEMQSDNLLAEANAITGVKPDKGYLRGGRSVDKNGNTSSDSNPSTDPNHPNYISETGMSWFPGYAVNIETGERLNMAFGEDSWLTNENGRDMLWNPTSKLCSSDNCDELSISQTSWKLGGRHFVMVFRNNIVEDTLAAPSPTSRMPSYDEGRFMTDILKNNTFASKVRPVWISAMWCMFPLVNDKMVSYNSKRQLQIPTEAVMKLRVKTSYKGYSPSVSYVSTETPLPSTGTYFVDKGPIVYNGTTYLRGDVVYMTAGSTFTKGGLNNFDLVDNVLLTSNAARPMYTFSTSDLAPEINNNDIAKEALDIINVVPNPYYAYSQYEERKLDYTVKFINLPKECTLSIYSPSGTLIRKYTKDDPTITSLNWDLKNHAGINIASGMYIIHIEVPGVGEKVLKWLGVMRPIDLDSF